MEGRTDLKRMASYDCPNRSISDVSNVSRSKKKKSCRVPEAWLVPQLLRVREHFWSDPGKEHCL